MKKIFFTLGKVMLAMSVVSSILMLILAFIMLKIDVSLQAQKVFVIIIYLVSTFVGGLILGKVMNKRKFIWGMGCGIVYFLVLLVIAFFVKNPEEVEGISLGLSAVICTFGGMLGGMAG